MVTRFELKMPADLRRELDDIAAATGTTPSELIRLGATWIVANRDFLLRGRPPVQTGVAA